MSGKYRIFEKVSLLIMTIYGYIGVCLAIENFGIKALLTFCIYVCFRFGLFIIDESYSER